MEWYLEGCIVIAAIAGMLFLILLAVPWITWCLDGWWEWSGRKQYKIARWWEAWKRK